MRWSPKIVRDEGELSQVFTEPITIYFGNIMSASEIRSVKGSAKIILMLPLATDLHLHNLLAHRTRVVRYEPLMSLRRLRTVREQCSAATEFVVAPRQ